MSTEKANSTEQCGFRHDAQIKALIDDIVTSENSNFTVVMRQITNEGLKAKYGTEIVGNKIVKRGSVPVLNQVSRAS